jgi:hypothetical protein
MLTRTPNRLLRSAVGGFAILRGRNIARPHASASKHGVNLSVTVSDPSSCAGDEEQFDCQGRGRPAGTPVQTKTNENQRAFSRVRARRDVVRAEARRSEK